MKYLSSKLRTQQVQFKTRWLFLVLSVTTLFVAAALLTLPERNVTAASPASGSIASTGPVLPFTGNWTGTATGTGANATEPDCVEGVSCDTFRLTVLPSAWVGKKIDAKIQWTVPTNDYDIYIHKCPNAGSTNVDCNATPTVGEAHGSVPQTEENSAIDPNNSGTGDYTIRVVYSAVTPAADQYQGSVSVGTQTATRTATYVTGGINFSPSVTARAPVAPRDGEPSNRTDKLGNFYIAGIRGFPAGVDLWYADLVPGSGTFDPFMRNLIYRGQPDAFSPDDEADLGGDGGGDVDLAVSMPDPVTGALPATPTLAASS